MITQRSTLTIACLVVLLLVQERLLASQCEAALTMAQAAPLFVKQSVTISAIDFKEQFLSAQSPLLTIQAVVQRNPEMTWFLAETSATPEGRDRVNGQSSYSFALFGKESAEFDRAATGIMAIKWILTGDFEALTRPQPQDRRLSRESFQKLRDFAVTTLRQPEDIDALVSFLVLSDLGKSKQLSARFKDLDHDHVLLKSIENDPFQLPSFVRLTLEYQSMIKNSLKSQFSFGKFLQGEGVPANLSKVVALERRTLDFYLLHSIADIAGAAGHVEPNGSLVLTNDIFKNIEAAITALRADGLKQSEQQVYSNYLQMRGVELGVIPHLQLQEQKRFALLRILLLMRVNTKAAAKAVAKSFEDLPPKTQTILLRELNISGLGEETAIVLSYAPAMLSNIFIRLNEAEAMSLGLRVLGQLFEASRKALQNSKMSNNVFDVHIGEVAEAAKDPKSLAKSNFLVKLKDRGGVVVIK